MNEIWAQIKEYPKYEISNLGNFRHIKHQHNRKLQLDRYGYYQVLLNLGKNHKPQYKGLLISRLVAQTFIPNPDNLPEVHHINNIRTDNQATNLQWIKRLNNLFKRNNFKKRISLNEQIIIQILELSKQGLTPVNILTKL
jgi:hypothetical protein